MGSKLLLAGNLDRRVTIVPDGAGTTDSWGQAVPGTAAKIVRSASLRTAPGTERFANAENAAQAVMRFVFRWEDGLVPVTARLIEGGRTYDVKSVTEIGRREGLEVLAVGRAE